jgi:hypothetical protein
MTEPETPAPATCSSCLAPIRWVLTLGDKRMPLDVDPHPDGNVVIITTPEGDVRGRVLTGEHLPAQDTAYRAHFVTCPNAADHRRRRAIVTPRCHGCHLPMDPVLGRTDLYHPNCAPDPTAMRAALDTARAVPEQEALDL